MTTKQVQQYEAHLKVFDYVLNGSPSLRHVLK